MINKTYQLETLGCPTCSGKIESMLKKTKGISYAEVFFNSSRAKVSFDEAIVSNETIKESIGKFGYQVISEK